MREDRDEVLIAYILDAIAKLTELTKRPDAKQQFVQDWLFHDAVLHRLQTMAESCQRYLYPRISKIF